MDAEIDTPPTEDDLLDGIDQQLAPYAHTFMGRYANHAPMAAEALVALGRTERAAQYVERWIGELDRIDPDSSYADWLAWARGAVADDWRAAVAEVATQSSRDGFAHIGHGVIRTGHAIRALRSHDSTARRGELARALAAWGDWAEPGPLPESPPHRDADDLVAELARRAMTGYATSESRQSFFALHTVTTSVAVGRVQAVLPPHLAVASVSAFLDAMVDAIADQPIDTPETDMPYDLDPLIDAAVASGDEHQIKLIDALVFPPDGIGPTDPSRDAAIERFATDLEVTLVRRSLGG